jgi:two-component system, NtrC family, sensor kinase
MTESSHKTLYERAQVLNLLTRDLERISSQLDPSRVIRFALRRMGEAVQADVVLQVDLRRTDGSFERPYVLSLRPPAESPPQKDGKTGDAPSARFLEDCRGFLRRPVAPEETDEYLLRILSQDRPLAVLGLRRPGRRFSRAENRFLQDAAAILAESLAHRERERVQALKERIYAKIIAEMRPEDVLYQILHGLKRLLQYDHGAAVFLLTPDRSCLTLQAEIVSWTKAKSERIGECLTLTPGLQQWLSQVRRPLLLRAGDAASAEAPEILLAPLRATASGVPSPRALIIGALRHRGHDLGLLQIRSRSATAFTPADLDVLAQFLPLASVTLYNSTLYKAQHEMLLTAERKNALADLARAISHDLNNAFGVMLPLLQTLRRDLQAGTTSPGQMARDLEVIERYAGSSARIFQGLLSAAQGAAEPASWLQLNSILEGILRMLGPGLEGKHIRVRRELAAELPTVFLRRGEMEQLFLNLVYNARDAMPEGVSLLVRTEAADGGLRCTLEDTGHGIPESIRGRIFEPFFTTKTTGSGLGLDICRSIVWDYDGRLEIASAPKRGTTVTIFLPRLAERLKAAAEAGREEQNA